MIGLINSLGSYQAARVQTTAENGTRHEEVAQTVAPVLNSEQAANRVLLTAIEAVQSSETGSERHTPSGEESDRFQQAELERNAHPTPVGARLDVVA